MSRYRMLAGYNAWCNVRLYEAAATVPDADYRADRGVFFKSLHGTLNHLLVADRIWMKRFTGAGDMPPLAPALDHFFNHQTHHRGQAHALLTAILGNDRAPSFDLIVYQRETGVGVKSMA